MDSVAARRSMVEALEGMNRAIDAARNKISSSSYLSTFGELHVVFIRCRVEIKDAAVPLEAAVVAAVEAATASRDGTVIWDLGLRIRGLKGLAKVWRGRQEEERWGRCLERCNHGSTEEWDVLSLKRVAATACRHAEHLVAQIPDPWVSAATASRDASASRRPRVWRGRLEQRWRRCLKRCNHGSTEKWVLSLKRIAAMACRNAEKLVAWLREPRVSPEGSTEEWDVLSLKRVAATACGHAEHLVAQIPDPWVSAAEAVEAATASRDACSEQRWRRCLKRCNHGSTEKWVLSLKRIAAMACRNAEKLVAWLREPRVSPELVDDAEGTALLADELQAVGRGRDAMEDSEEYQGILREMGRLFSSA